MPELRPDDRRFGGRRIGIDHHRGSQGKCDEPVHGQKVGNATLRVAEFPGSGNVHNGGLDGTGDHLAAAHGSPGIGFLFTHVFRKIPGALLVHHIEYRAGNHQEDHHGDVTLHDGGRQP